MLFSISQDSVAFISFILRGKEKKKKGAKERVSERGMRLELKMAV